MNTPAEWQILHASSHAALVSARPQVHHAVQLVSAVGASLLPARDDFDHTSLVFEPAQGILAGHTVDGVRAGLDVEPLELLVRRGEHEVARRPLHGDKPAAALGWLSATIAGLLGRPVRLEPPVHDLPAFPGPVFELQPAGARELVHVLQDTHRLLAPLLAEPQATALRVWPHHLDLALRLALDGERGIGIGVSPGDGTCPGPYLYVTPWPYPGGVLPGLPEGRWNREGWTGALLPLHEGPTAAAGQEARARTFLTAAIEVCRRLLG